MRIEAPIFVCFPLPLEFFFLRPPPIFFGGGGIFFLEGVGIFIFVLFAPPANPHWEVGFPAMEHTNTHKTDWHVDSMTDPARRSGLYLLVQVKTRCISFLLHVYFVEDDTKLVSGYFPYALPALLRFWTSYTAQHIDHTAFTQHSCHQNCIWNRWLFSWVTKIWNLTVRNK